MAKYMGYRPNVAAIVLSSDYELTKNFVIARRIGVKRGWQFPQGGIDGGETPREALLREFKEEMGTDEIDILGEYPDWIQYDFPAAKGTKVYPFRGQSQKYFLVRLRSDESIDLGAYDMPEFDEYRLVTLDQLFKKISYFKRPSYRRVIAYFKEKGQL